jgi:hypothetical protein
MDLSWTTRQSDLSPFSSSRADTGRRSLQSGFFAEREWPTFNSASQKYDMRNRWWACLDSNQEPDRYERPALTIELQAPPQAAAFTAGNGADTPYNAAGDPAMPPRRVMPGRAGREPGLSRFRVWSFGPSRMTVNNIRPMPWPRHDICRPTSASSPPRRPRIRPPCAIFRSRRQSACRTRPASSASGFRPFRQAARPAWDLSAPRRPPC